MYVALTIHPFIHHHSPRACYDWAFFSSEWLWGYDYDLTWARRWLCWSTCYDLCLEECWKSRTASLGIFWTGWIWSEHGHLTILLLYITPFREVLTSPHNRYTNSWHPLKSIQFHFTLLQRHSIFWNNSAILQLLR